MDDNITIRAVTIGVSIFITLATVTAVMMYYNIARSIVDQTGIGINLEQQYREDIKNTLYNSEVTGAELRNILQYFYDSYEVTIVMSSYYAYSSTEPVNYVPISIPAGDRIKINSVSNNSYIKIMKTMMPNQRFKVTRDTTDQNKYTFTLVT